MSSEIEIKHAIILELRKTCRHLGGESGIMAIVCSYDDTMDDQSTLEQLKEWNEHGQVHPQYPHAELMLRRLLAGLLNDPELIRKGDDAQLESSWKRAMQPLFAAKR